MKQISQSFLEGESPTFKIILQKIFKILEEELIDYCTKQKLFKAL